MAILEIYMPTHNLCCSVCNWTSTDQVPAQCPECHTMFDAAVIQASNGSWLFSHKPGNGVSIRPGKKAARSWDRAVGVNDAN